MTTNRQHDHSRQHLQESTTISSQTPVNTYIYHAHTNVCSEFKSADPEISKIFKPESKVVAAQIPVGFVV